MARLTYLSYTGFTKLDSCAESWQREYLLKQRPPFGDERNVLRGNALHNMMERYILNKKHDPQWLVNNIDKYWEKEIHKAKIIEWRGPNDRAELQKKVRAWALELAKLFNKHGLDPNNMQPEFKADTNVVIGGHRFKMGGRIDILMRTKSGELMFLDLKGSENKDVMKLDQLCWYSILLEEFCGEPAPYGGYLLPGFPDGKRFPVFRISDGAKEELKQRIIKGIERVKADDFAPTPESKTCYWCPVKPECSLYGGATEKVSGIVDLVPSNGGIDGLL